MSATGLRRRGIRCPQRSRKYCRACPVAAWTRGSPAGLQDHCPSSIARQTNIVRHPDMPEQAFADMWSTPRAGESWTALVKNRRKYGGYYWVRATVTPIRRNGQITGCMPVRTKPSRDEIASAQACYRAFRENTAVGMRFHRGLIVRTGPRAWCSALMRMPVRWPNRMPRWPNKAR